MTNAVVSLWISIGDLCRICLFFCFSHFYFGQELQPNSTNCFTFAITHRDTWHTHRAMSRKEKENMREAYGLLNGHNRMSLIVGKRLHSISFVRSIVRFQFLVQFCVYVYVCIMVTDFPKFDSHSNWVSIQSNYFYC